MSFLTFLRNLKQKLFNYWSIDEKEIRLLNKVVRKRENNDCVKLDNYRLTILLSFVLLGAFSFLYLAYSDYKYNIASTIEIKPKEIVSISIENPIDTEIPGDYIYENYTLKNGDNLLNILTKEIGLTKKDAFNFIAELGKIYNPKNIKTGQEISLKYRNTINFVNNNIEQNTILEELKLFDDSTLEEYLIYRENENTYSARKNKVSLTTYYNRFIVNIKSNLYMDAIKAGIPAEIIANMINYYSFDIDFQRDIRSGDWFEVVYEGMYTESGKIARNGDIIYANLHTNKNDHKIYKFMQNNNIMYFNENGLSTRKSLLKTPINGARITSNFGNRRKHPILGYTKAHKGIDFGAPVGTPFYAAGNGTVKKVITGCITGNKSCGKGYGNYILIQHNSSYSSEYAHLSKVNKGIKVGTKVKQGQVIGFVGNTGLSTGPHLHYGIIYKNERINPNRIKSISSIRLSGNDLLNFINEKEKIDQLRSSAINQSQLNKKYTNN